jgi:hypothetical protein
LAILFQSSRAGSSSGRWLPLLEQVASHQDIVDVPSVELELRSQGALDLEPARW